MQRIEEKQQGEVTFNDILTSNIEEFEKSNQYIRYKESQTQENFELYEDLKLLLELSKKLHINRKTFQNLENQKTLKRSGQSLEQRYIYLILQGCIYRYNDCIKYLTSQDLQKIVEFLKDHQLNGSLIFENNRLMRIEHHQDQNQFNIHQQLNSNQQYKKKSLQPTPRKIVKLEQPTIYKLKYFTHLSLTIFRKQYQIEPTIAKGEFQDITEDDKEQLNQLQHTLNLLSQWTNISKKRLAETLDQCSGDLNVLQEVLCYDMEELLWIKEEDEILKDICKNKNDQDNTKLNLLIRYKGEQAVKKRAEWLNLTL